MSISPANSTILQHCRRLDKLLNQTVIIFVVKGNPSAKACKETNPSAKAYIEIVECVLQYPLVALRNVISNSFIDNANSFGDIWVMSVAVLVKFGDICEFVFLFVIFG